jgi:apolipoprotein N-acyltransferase
MGWGLISSFLVSMAMPNLLFLKGLTFYRFEIILSLAGMALVCYFYPKYVATKRSLSFLTGFSVTHFLMLFYWMPVPIHTFRDFPWVPSCIMGVFFFVLNSIPHILNSLFLRFLILKNLVKLVSIPSIALVFILVEDFIPQFLPLSWGHSLLRIKSTSFWASLGGLPLVSFLVYSWGLTLISEIKIKYKIFLSIFFLLIYNLPIFLDQQSPKLHQLQLTLVQPNISNQLKKRAEEVGTKRLRKEIEEKLIFHTGEDPKGLIVWPETAIPFYTFLKDLQEQKITPFNHVFLGKQDLLTGIFIKLHPDYNLVTNSAILLQNGKVQGRYDKGHLKPFAEYFPLPWFQPWAERLVGAPYNLRGGERVSSFSYQGFKFSTTICYEALKGPYWAELLNDNGSPEESSLVFNLANDNWFNQTSEPYLHYFMNQWRSLEFHIPIVRVANGGVSGIIYPDDLDFLKLPAFTETSLVTEVKFSKREKTPYQRWGLLPTILLAFLATLIAAILKKKVQVY